MSRFRILLFARYAESLGAEEVAVDLPGESTVASLIDALRAMPGGDVFPARVVIARNLAIANPTDRIAPTDELAVLPPMAGG